MASDHEILHLRTENSRLGSSQNIRVEQIEQNHHEDSTTKAIYASFSKDQYVTSSHRLHLFDLSVAIVVLTCCGRILFCPYELCNPPVRSISESHNIDDCFILQARRIQASPSNPSPNVSKTKRRRIMRAKSEKERRPRRVTALAPLFILLEDS